MLKEKHIRYSEWRLLTGLILTLLFLGCTESPAPQMPQLDPEPAVAQPPVEAPRPTVKVAANPVQANLPPNDPRAWAKGTKYQAPPVSPLTEQESRLQSQVQSAGGRFEKRTLTAEERQTNAQLGVSLGGDAVLAVDFDRMKSSGKLAALESLDGVSELGLSRSDVGDNDLQQLAKAKDLVVLDLNFTEVTDAGLAYLEGLRNLRLLVVENTHVTAEGVRKLRQANPRLRIFHFSVQQENAD